MKTVNWKNGAIPSLILKEINKSRNYDANTKTSSFEAVSFHTNSPILESLLIFPKNLDDLEQIQLINSTLASIPEDFNEVTFIKEINLKLQEELRKPVTEFHVLTSISAKNVCLPKQFSFLECVIQFYGFHFPKKYGDRRAALVGCESIPDEPPDYCRVVVKTRAKTPRGAMVRAMRAIDGFRGLWCLQVNTEIELLGMQWEPIDKLRLGPLHSVHGATGKIEPNTVWFEPNYVKANIFSTARSAIIMRNCARTRRNLVKSSLSEEIIAALVSYARALDEKDADVAFLKLRSSMERLTSPNSNYAEVIRRCSFIWKEREYVIQVLEHLRNFRNKSVHAGDPSDLAKAHCFSLQIYFRLLFWFFLTRTKDCQNLHGVWEFLDQPDDVTALQRRSKLAQEAVRYLSTPPRSKITAD